MLLLVGTFDFGFDGFGAERADFFLDGIVVFGVVVIFCSFWFQWSMAMRRLVDSLAGVPLMVILANRGALPVDSLSFFRKNVRVKVCCVSCFSPSFCWPFLLFCSWYRSNGIKMNVND